MPNSVTAGGTEPDSIAVAGELARLASSNCFRKAERCLRLLRHLTNLTLEGRSAELKEYALGVTVLDRPDSYDPRVDPVVRLEARRLRLKLAEYYQEEGLDDPVIIDLPKGGYVPEFRFRTAPETVAAPPPDFSPPPAVATPFYRRLPFWLIFALVLLAISITGWYRFRKTSSGLPVRNSVAVLGFRDLSPLPETSWVSVALSELINIDLGAEQRLRTLPLENVVRVRTELSLTPQPVYPVQALQRIRADLGSDYVVTGSYLTRDRRIHLEVMLFDARSGQQVAAISDDAPEDALPDLARRCAGRIRAQLGVRLPSVGLPTFQTAAMEQYARGMERLRQEDALGARAYLEKAVAMAPSNPLFHSGLAAALSALGLDIQAGQVARRAWNSSADLGRVEQLEIEGRYCTVVHDWPRAIQVYQALFTLLPDDLENGLLLARVEVLAGQGQEALRTARSLRSLPSPLGDDPRIDLTEAQAAGTLSDFARTRQAAHSAADKAKARGARLQYAKARLLESGAMQNLNIAGYEDVRTDARRVCAELGDRFCVASAYRIEANAMLATGQLAVAQRLYQAAFEIANQIGNSLEKLNVLSGLSYVARLQGDLPAQEGYSRAALAIAVDLGPQKCHPVYLDLADVLAESGRIAEAQSYIGKALQLARQIGEREGTGMSEAALAHTLALQGQSAAAIAKYNQALGILREVNEPYEVGETLLDLGHAQLDQGDLAGARKSLEESRLLARAFPGAFGQPEIELALAHLGLAEGHFADAASHARLALSGFTSSGREGDRYQAAAALTRALLGQARVQDASAVLAQFPAPDARKFPARSVIQFEIARCFALAGAGHEAEALRAIDLLVVTTARGGIPKLHRDALEAKKAIAKTPARAKSA